MSGKSKAATPVYKTMMDGKTFTGKIRYSAVRDVVICALSSVCSEDPYDSGYFDFFRDDISLTLNNNVTEIKVSLRISSHSDPLKIEPALRAELKEGMGQTFPELRYELTVIFSRVG